jgi:hypothetical protein
MLPNKEQSILLWGAWKSDEISRQAKQMIVNQLSGGILNETPKEKKMTQQAWQRAKN